MSALGLPVAARRIGPAGLLALALAAVHALIIAGAIITPARVDADLATVAYPAPFVLAFFAIFARRLPPGVGLALGISCLMSGAAFLAILVSVQALVLLLIPMLALAAFVVGLFPVQGIVATFVLTGIYGSVTAFWEYPAGETVDVLLGGLWLAAIWGWWMGGARRPTWIWPGVMCLAAYVAISACEILFAETTTIGIHWFRASIWYLAAGLLVAYAPWPPGSRLRIARAVLVIAAAVGAYGTFRWLAGPADAERELAEQSKNNFLGDELRPVGSFPNSKELVAWCAIVAPYCLACALMMRDRWRLVGLAGCVLLPIAMLSADVRTGPVALAVGVVVVVGLHLAAVSVPSGRKTAVTAIAVGGALLVGAGAFVATLSGKEETGRRYEAIVKPKEDPAVQGRFFKWESVLADVGSKPFGNGPGTAGRVQKEKGRFHNVASIDVDNSYLKVAFEQGVAMLVFLVTGFLLLLVGLARRAIGSRHVPRAAIAIGACGSLAAMLMTFASAEHIEGLPALAGWLIVGLGVAQFASVDPDAPAA